MANTEMSPVAQAAWNAGVAAIGAPSEPTLGQVYAMAGTLLARLEQVELDGRPDDVDDAHEAIREMRSMLGRTVGGREALREGHLP
jgi:hypothetical protein